MESSSFNGSGILPNVNQSIHSGILEHDLVSIPTQGIMIDNDIPLLPRTQQYNLARIEGIQLGNHLAAPQHPATNQMRQSNVSQTVRFADHIQTSSVQHRQQSQAGSQVSQGILLNHSSFHPLQQLNMMRQDSIQVVVPRNNQYAQPYYQPGATVHVSPLASPRQSMVQFGQSSARLLQTNQNLNSGYSRAPGIPLSQQFTTSQHSQRTQNISQSRAPSINVDTSHQEIQMMNNLILNSPELINTPSLTKPEESISERTVNNVLNYSRMERSGVQNPQLIGSVISNNPQATMMSQSKVSHQQQSHQQSYQQSNRGSYVQQTVQHQEIVNSNRVSNVSNINNQNYIQQGVQSKSILNSNHSYNPSLLNTQKSGISPQLAQNQVTNKIVEQIGRMTESNVLDHQSSMLISQALATNLDNNNNNITNSKASCNIGVLMNQSNRSNANHQISTLLAQGVNQNMMNSKRTIVDNNIMNSSHVPGQIQTPLIQSPNPGLINSAHQQQMETHSLRRSNVSNAQAIIGQNVAQNVSNAIINDALAHSAAKSQTSQLYGSQAGILQNNQFISKSQHNPLPPNLELSHRSGNPLNASNIYTAVVTPASQILEANNIGYQVIPPTKDLSLSQMSRISNINKQQIRQDGHGGIIKTTIIQQVISPQITQPLYFMQQMKILLGLTPEQGIEQAQQILNQLRLQNNYEIQRLRNQIITKEQQKQLVQQEFHQSLQKFKYNVMVIEQAERNMYQQKMQQSLLIQQNNQIKQQQLLTMVEIERMKQDFEAILIQRQQSSIRHKNEIQTNVYYTQELETRVQRLNMSLEEVRCCNERNRSQFDLQLSQFFQQIRALEEYKTISQQQALELQIRIQQLCIQKQILQNQLNNKDILNRQKQTGLEENNIKINNLNETINMLTIKHQQLEQYPYELERLRVLHQQMALDFERKEKNYYIQIDIEKKRIMDLERHLTEYQKYQLINKQQLRQINRLQDYIRQKNGERSLELTQYRTQILNLRTAIEMMAAQKQQLQLLAQTVPLQHVNDLRNLKQQHAMLNNQLLLQKRLRIEQRSSIQRQFQMTLGAMRTQYQTKLTNLNRRCEQIQRENDLKIINQNSRYSNLIIQNQKTNQMWQRRYSKIAQQLHIKQNQLCSIICNSQQSGNAIEELKRINNELLLRLREEEGEKKMLRQNIEMFKVRESDLQKNHIHKYEEIEIGRCRLEEEHRREMVRKQKDFQYQKNILLSQYQDAQERIKTLTCQYQALLEQLNIQRKKYLEVSTIRTQIVDNPTLAFKLKHKEQFIYQLNKELQDARNRLRAVEQQWRVLESQNKGLMLRLESEKVESNRYNYDLKCQISDLTRRIESQALDLRSKQSLTSILPTNTHIHSHTSMQMIDQFEPTITERFHPIEQHYSVDKTATFENRTSKVTERVQKISTPSKIQSGNVVHQVSPLSGVTTNQAISRCITAETTISAAPTSRVHYPPVQTIHQSPSKLSRCVINVSPPIVQQKIHEVKVQKQITNIPPNIVQNKDIRRLHSPQINNNHRLRGRIQPEMRGNIEMKSNKAVIKNQIPHLQNQRTIISNQVIHQAQTVTTNSKFINNFNRSRSNSKSPHTDRRPPLSPSPGPLVNSQTSRISYALGPEVLKNIPVISPIINPIHPTPDYVEPRTLNHVRSTPSLPPTSKHQTFSSTSINNMIVQKQVSRQESLKTSTVTNNIINTMGGTVSEVQSYISEGDYGMNVMQKQDLDKRNCC